MSKDEVQFHVGLTEEDLETVQVPVADLMPLCPDDHFKQASKELIEHKSSQPSWDTPWRPAATSKREFLENAGQIEYLRGLTADTGVNPNLLAFANHGGIANGGVCWWHSRFQRAALYLAYFLPDAPKPSTPEARAIIASIMAANRVVPIPGYSNLRDFSSAYEAEIQKRIERTQLIESLFQFCWIDGLSGATELPPKELEKQMNEIYAEVQKNGLSYVKLQMPGIFRAHAWIITDMRPRDGGGYDYSFLDSNQPDYAMGWFYRPGDKALNIFGSSMGVPYLQRSNELNRMKQLIKKYRESE